ncbi:MAG TPA: SPFH domain-containing protein [Spirochaetota bacterium]|nr:SPFH domain-containing protein [Spirochaetota bacterium]HPF06005.1 SPFH domain-containing protein [Spirochaetota bacterium]HPJ41845.1 SPFH domain-containing protein [Spirochaetota bacterium]HPR36812.1 SPFH domain-containing protein [Spirochaetota bacterium]HRX46351.1 SPFH domain-containing protein [Spirochaetota bacterium]
MKDIIKLLLKTSVFLLIIYSIIFSFFRLDENEYGLVRDNNNQIVTGFKNRYNFIWQGSLPWDYKIEKINLKNSSLFDVIVQIPSLSSLTDDIYFIKIPLNILYRINKDNLPDISFLSEKKLMDQYISNTASSICSTMLVDYLTPQYSRERLLKEQKRLNDDIAAELNKKLNLLGVIAEKIEFILPGYYPDTKLYQEALLKNREMRELEFSTKKQEVLMKKQLLKEKSEFEFYFEKLSKVSALIKDNPGILKYIYIDKMGDNIKVIISSDKTGIPAVLGESGDNNNPGVKGDVDNLR